MKLSSLFSDHAVLQQNQSIPVWGWTEPKTIVKAELNGNTTVSISNDHGKFLLRLPPIQAGGPHQLTVTEIESGASVTVDDILIGEVWVASGQSNMAMALAGCEMPDEVAVADHHEIRMITVDRTASMGKRADIEANWKTCTPENVTDFSAAAYFFAHRLHAELNVPVGIISSAWGGTFIETWTSRETLIRNPDLTSWIERYELNSQAEEAWLTDDEEPTSKYRLDPGNDGVARDWHEPGFDDSHWSTMPAPSSWQNQGFQFSGIFWFRKKIRIPESWLGKDLLLSIGAVDKQDITYFNGTEVGRTGSGLEDKYWDVKREYPIPAAVNKNAECTIAVRAYSFVFSGGLIGPGQAMKLSMADDPEETIPLTGDWSFQIEHNFGFISTQLPMGQDNPNSPYMLFDNHIFPLLPYAIAGFIWYQGESNAGSPLHTRRYQREIKDLITDWRFQWGQGDLPFIQVQLANFRLPKPYEANSLWALLREAQMKGLELDNTGVAVIIDVGDADDIHPKDKKTVGERLAQWALAETYGKPIVPCGPVYDRHILEDDKIRIFFKHTGQGLSTNDSQAPRTFCIASDNRVFQTAKAKIQGNTVLVWNDDIDNPEAVRYAWADNPENTNLYNRDRLPASPFRTDDWPIM